MCICLNCKQVNVLDDLTPVSATPTDWFDCLKAIFIWAVSLCFKGLRGMFAYLKFCSRPCYIFQFYKRHKRII